MSCFASSISCRPLRSWPVWPLWLLSLALLGIGCCMPAAAQDAAPEESESADPPGRVARLNFHEGRVSFAPAGDDNWYDAQPNRPVTTGDRLWTDRGTRAELYIGSAALRLGEQTEIEFSELGDDSVRLTSQQGRLQLHLRQGDGDDDFSGQRVEIDTGNLALVIDAPGDYRIAADPAAGTTWVAVSAGHAVLYGENGESQSLNARQQLTVSGRQLVAVQGGAGAMLAGDSAFDDWVAERGRIEDQSVSARHVSREVPGYQQLDDSGDWQEDPAYGSVWYPSGVDADWAPYQDGQWIDVAPWGPTWVDAAPWGFAPFHYGRWARVGSRWGWVPGRRNARPVYAPALVGFVGGSGRNGVGWFPLAPGESWRPGYHASQRYVARANRMAALRNRQQQQTDLRNPTVYANQQLPGAVTAVPVDRFGRGPFGRRDLLRLPDNRFAHMPVMPAPGVAVASRGLAGPNGFNGPGRPGSATPPAAWMAARQEQRRQIQVQRQSQQGMQQPGMQGQALLQQQQQQMQLRQQRQQQLLRQQQEIQQRGALLQQNAMRQAQEAQMRARQQQRRQEQMQQRAFNPPQHRGDGGGGSQRRFGPRDN